MPFFKLNGLEQVKILILSLLLLATNAIACKVQSVIPFDGWMEKLIRTNECIDVLQNKVMKIYFIVFKFPPSNEVSSQLRELMLIYCYFFSSISPELKSLNSQSVLEAFQLFLTSFAVFYILMKIMFSPLLWNERKWACSIHEVNLRFADHLHQVLINICYETCQKES